MVTMETEGPPVAMVTRLFLEKKLFLVTNLFLGGAEPASPLLLPTGTAYRDHGTSGTESRRGLASSSPTC